MNKQNGYGLIIFFMLVIMAMLGYECYRDYKGVNDETTAQYMQENQMQQFESGRE